MMRAALISIALAGPAAAQPVACFFTIVCAPEIECEAHEGIPFEIAYRGGVHWLDLDGEDVAGSMLSDAPSLSLSFVAPGETLLFSMTDDGEGVLTRHRVSTGARLLVASFLGRCVTA